MHEPTSQNRPALLTPKEAAFRLLEEATLEALRTKGLAGLMAVNDGRRKMFRPQDVDAFIRDRLATECRHEGGRFARVRRDTL